MAITAVGCDDVICLKTCSGQLGHLSSSDSAFGSAQRL